MLAGTYELDPRQSVNQANQPSSERAQLLPVENGRAHKAFEGLDETNNSRQVLGSCASLVLVAAAEQNGGRMQGKFDKKRPSPLWPVDLMPTDGNQVGIELLDAFKGLFAEPLDSIRMENHAKMPDM